MFDKLPPESPLVTRRPMKPMFEIQRHCAAAPEFSHAQNFCFVVMACTHAGYLEDLSCLLWRARYDGQPMSDLLADFGFVEPEHIVKALDWRRRALTLPPYCCAEHAELQ